MDITQVSQETFDFFNSDALQYMAEYFQINRLPPRIQHLRINRNEMFHEHFVICDVMQQNRILEILPK